MEDRVFKLPTLDSYDNELVKLICARFIEVQNQGKPLDFAVTFKPGLSLDTPFKFGIAIDAAGKLNPLDDDTTSTLLNTVDTTSVNGWCGYATIIHRSTLDQYKPTLADLEFFLQQHNLRILIIQNSSGKILYLCKCYYKEEESMELFQESLASHSKNPVGWFVHKCNKVGVTYGCS